MTEPQIIHLVAGILAREPHSSEYREGMIDTLVKMHGGPAPWPKYAAGTVQCDAYQAGRDRGRNHYLLNPKRN